MPIPPLAVRAYSAVSAAGIGRDALHRALAAGRSCLQPNRCGPPTLPTWVGAVAALDEPGAAQLLPAHLRAHWDARATRLAWLALEADEFIAQAHAAIARHGAVRVGLVLGTSASTIAVSEAAYRALALDGGFPPPWRSPRLNTPHALTAFVAEALGVAGPTLTVSTACSSSAKAFAVAERWLRLGLVDAAIVGGVDALAQSVLYGFAALGLVSPAACRPFDRRRNGISVGEAAGFALLEREAGTGDAPLALLGHGEASDAHHMSSPHPEGLGAQRALLAALARAGLAAHPSAYPSAHPSAHPSAQAPGRACEPVATGIHYVNLHGTASAQNDEVEAALLARCYGPGTLASGTKGLTGHTMGAAGMLEAAICLVALERALAPGTAGCEEPLVVASAQGATLAPRLLLAPQPAPLATAASHSFGFGGSNAVLIFGRRG